MNDWTRVYLPTQRDATAMDGAPVHRGWFGEEQHYRVEAVIAAGRSLTLR